MDLNLIASWLQSAVSQHISEKLHVKVADTNCLGQAFLLQGFHFCPQDVHRNGRSSQPIDWPMDQIQIRLFDLELSKRFAEGRFRFLILIVPDLGHYVEILSANHSLTDASLDSLAYKLLILVEACSV